MNSPRLTYTPRPNATPQGERVVLADALRFILDSAEKRGRLPDKSGLDDGTKVQGDDSADAPIVQQ